MVASESVPVEQCITALPASPRVSNFDDLDWSPLVTYHFDQRKQSTQLQPEIIDLLHRFNAQLGAYAV